MPLSEGTGIAIGAGINAIGQFASNIAKTKRGYSRQRRMLERQNAINVENWNKQNAYNSPSAQMARFRAAGLNPNLIYQNGGAMSQAGEIGQPSAQYDDYPGFFDGVPQAVSQAVSSMTTPDAVQAEIDKKIEETEGQRIENENNRQYLGRRTEKELRNMDANYAIMQQQEKFLTAQTGLTDAQTQEAILNWSKIPVEISVLRSQQRLNDKNIDHLDAVIKNVNANTDLVTQKYQMAIVEKALMDLQYAAESQADQNTYELMIQNLAEQVDKLSYENQPEYRQYQLIPDWNVSKSFKVGPFSVSRSDNKANLLRGAAATRVKTRTKRIARGRW